MEPVGHVLDSSFREGEKRFQGVTVHGHLLTIGDPVLRTVVPRGTRAFVQIRIDTFQHAMRITRGRQENPVEVPVDQWKQIVLRYVIVLQFDFEARFAVVSVEEQIEIGVFEGFMAVGPTIVFVEFPFTRFRATVNLQAVGFVQLQQSRLEVFFLRTVDEDVWKRERGLISFSGQGIGHRHQSIFIEEDSPISSSQGMIP